MVKLGFTRVYIIFLFLLRNIDCFEQKYEKYHIFYLKMFFFLVVKFSVYLNRHVFVIEVKQFYSTSPEAPSFKYLVFKLSNTSVSVTCYFFPTCSTILTKYVL